jgi:MFS family permease
MIAADPNARRLLPRTVWTLGLVSMFMDISSEIVHALLPLFLTVGLGASVALVGLIDGAAEATASFVKLFSGYISDRIGKRKPLILFGYGVAAVTKPLFAIATGPGMVFAARFADRFAKGVRGAPRDAMIADATPTELRGRAYGLRQALDTAGAFAGPLIALALMAAFAGDMRMVFAVAIIPGAIAAALVFFGVEEKAPPRAAERPPVRFADFARFGPSLRLIIALASLFTLARFSEAFLVLKAADAGLPTALAPLVLIVMNAAYGLGAFPAGRLSDRAPPHVLLLWGLGALIGADLLLAFSNDLAPIFCGVALWGAHMALTQGLFAKLVAQHAPEDLRASAFGLYHLATGVALFVASAAAGLLWDGFGPSSAFYAGAASAIATAAAVFALRKRLAR